MTKLTNDLFYIGVNDILPIFLRDSTRCRTAWRTIPILSRMKRSPVFDTVDARFTHEWLDHVEEALDGRTPDYLIIQHMEPDHAGSIAAFLRHYTRVTVAASAKAFPMMRKFFGEEYADRRLILGEGDTLSSAPIPCGSLPPPWSTGRR